MSLWTELRVGDKLTSDKQKVDVPNVSVDNRESYFLLITEKDFLTSLRPSVRSRTSTLCHVSTLKSRTETSAWILCLQLFGT